MPKEINVGKKLLLLLFTSVLFPSLSLSAYSQICGRDADNSMERPAIYRAKVPGNWQRIDPSALESITDTMKPLCEFLIVENQQQIRITIHNFPSDSAENRIPAQAQVARWKRQFSQLDPETVSITPEAYHGFTGLQFEGTGTMNGEVITVLGWAMQIATEHYSALQWHIGQMQDANSLKQMQADYTIKAKGPREHLKKHKQAIIAFARSFELIEEIPSFS